MERNLKLKLESARLRRQRMVQLHPLRTLFWECTLNCNMQCRHCGSDCRTTIDAHEMPFEHFERVLDIVKEHQRPDMVMVPTVGGEPLVRRDIIDCGRRITEKGYVWGMVSNGLLIDGPMMRELARAGLRTISVDVDGTRDHHNWLRRCEVSYDRVFQAIRHISETPRLMWDVITCVHPRNLPSLPELRRLLIEAGVKRWRCFTIVPMGRAEGDDTLVLSPEEMCRLMEFLTETRRQGQIMVSYACEGFLGDYEGKARGHMFNCQAGVTTASVLSDGSISGCLSIRSSYHQGNIYKDDFWEVWQHRFSPYRDHEWMHTGECADCDMWRYCQGNGFHLRRDDGSLMLCHHHKIAQGRMKAETCSFDSKP